MGDDILYALHGIKDGSYFEGYNQALTDLIQSVDLRIVDKFYLMDIMKELLNDLQKS